MLRARAITSAPMTTDTPCVAGPGQQLRIGLAVAQAKLDISRQGLGE
jgi:hypothetical protein